jgi:ABC-type antimicrobial peptide transport system permease subunit
MEIAQIYIGPDMIIDIDKAVDLFNDDEIRIEAINGGSKWFIRSFIEFQYGTLNPDNRVHLSIINILEKNKIKPLVSPLLGVKDKDKDMDKDKVKDKDYKKYGIFNNVKLTDEELSKLKEKFSDYTDRIENLGEYMKSKGRTYKSHYATILNWSRKDKKEGGLNWLP